MDALLRFRDHEGFQKTALLAVGLAAASGAIAASAGANSAIFAGAVAGATVLALRPGTKRALTLLRALFVFVAAVCLDAWPGDVGVLSFGTLVGFALVLDLPRKSLLWAMPAACGVMTAALWTAAHVGMSTMLVAAPAAVLGALVGGVFGTVGTFAMALRHVQVGPTAVRRAFVNARDKSSGDIHEIVVRAHGVWQRAQVELPEGDPNRVLLEEAVIRLLDVAAEWSAVAGDADASRKAALEDRMRSLTEKREAATDPEVDKQYAQAQAALNEQLGYLADLGLRRQRMVARLENYLATMERLQLANHRAAVSQSGDVWSDLRDLGEDFELDAGPQAAS